MHCWEFHHQIEGGAYQWFWRSVTAEGKIHSESTHKFATFLLALNDAMENGFDRELHEWYLATPRSAPCLKTIDDPPRAARGNRKS
jgi:hypothetical protein